MKKLVLIILLFASNLIWSQGLHTNGKMIVDENGNEVILRGMGLGGWMIQEGYMMQTAGVAGTQHEIRNKLNDLIGTTKTDEFYDAWLANGVTKKDIDSLAKWGFNSIRVPLHYNLFTLPIEDEPVAGQNTWLTKGFNLIDNLLSWCAADKIYLILDLHAAPGGQGTNADISDYDPTKPSLWENPLNKQKTVALWQKLAERYKNEKWIGGYDLLNETNWNMTNNSDLKNLYVEITNAIRQVDQNHILFIEGNWFANDFTGLTPPWDNNFVYSFHKYWSYNDLASIQWVINLRNNYNVPIWAGEAGENSNVWFRDAIKLFEDNNIGWSWWPLKRFETTVSPFSVATSPGYNKIVSYWKGEGPKPTVDEAYAGLMQVTNNLLAENCTYHKDVIDAMFRQVYSDETIPFKNHVIPGIIYMSDYDLGTLNNAYYDMDNANYQVSTGNYQAWNSGWAYRNDGVDIEKDNETTNSNGYHVGFLRKNEWIKYTVNVTESAAYTLKVHYASPNNGGKFHLSVDGEDITPIQQVDASGGWLTFKDKLIYNIILEGGVHKMVFHADADVEFNISSIEFQKSGTIDSVPFNVVNGNTGLDEKSINLSLNQSILQASISTISLADFTVIVNGISKPISSFNFDINKPKTLVINLNESLLFSDEIYVSYTGNNLQSSLNNSLPNFSNLKILNDLPKRFLIPGKIESEDFTTAVGLSTETCTDIGGGSDVGYTDSGDYADYSVFVTSDGDYKVSIRTSSQSTAGQLGLYWVENNSLVELKKINTPVTGDWQTWQTTSTTINLTKGTHILRMKVLASGFNLNWMNFELVDTDNDGVGDSVDKCPNTPEGNTVDTNGCSALLYDNFKIEFVGEGCLNKNDGKIIITANNTENYQTTISGTVYNFTKNLEVDNLSPGSYSFCIKVTNTSINQCYVVNIPKGKEVSGKINVDSKKAIVKIIDGTAPFKVFLNGKESLETSNLMFSIDVKSGDLIEVKTAKSCEGIISKKIDSFDEFKVYPNPTNGNVEINLPYTSKEVTIELYNLQLQLIFRKTYSNSFGKVQMNIDNQPTGMYILKILSEKPVFLKILKK